MLQLMSPIVKRLVIAGSAFLLLLVMVFTVVTIESDGGFRELFQLPAAVVPADSAKQDGFSLVLVSRGHPDDSDVVLPGGSKMFLAAPQSSGDTVLWIAPPLLPPTRLLRATTIHDSGQLQSFFNITVTSSAGDTFQIPWHYEGGCLEGGGEPCIDTRTASISPHIIAAVIPGGYPSDVTSFQVTITDPYGHCAHWQLTHLPRMEYATPSDTKSHFSHGGASVSLTAVRTYDNQSNKFWPTVKLTMTIGALPTWTRHRWALFQRESEVPELTWQPYKPFWMLSTSDQSSRRPPAVFWNFSHDHSYSTEFAEISSPYVRENNTASFYGVLTQYETRTDSVHLRDVPIDIIWATEAGTMEDMYCLSLKHKMEIVSGSGLTIVLPKQQKSAKNFLLMAPDSLNLLWHISPITPGHNSETAAMLPDSPLCKQYHRPVSVWFEASADGKPLGVCAGLPDGTNVTAPIMVHFPAPYGLPHLIHDLKITVHQRVDLLRIPVTLTAPIKPY